MATAALRVAESAENTARATVRARQEETRRAGDEARYTDTIQTHAQITSPITGLVTKRQVEIGNTVAPGTTLFRVVDDQTVCVAARIDVSQMGRIQDGQRSRIRLASGSTAGGAVARISHESDPVTRDQEVRVKFDTAPAHLTLNEEAEVIISVGEARGLVIPGSAVLPIEGVDGVLVVRDGRAERVVVKIGAVGQGKVQILGGLGAGDQVITHPEKVKPGQRVDATIGAD
jgi:RND family efflux transporter MFP subunit